MEFKYFKPSEFEKCVPSCSIDAMSERFLSLLDYARELACVPFKLNSAYRSKEYELSKGRSGSSSHCKGIAVDIACGSSSMRYCIVSALLQCGFRRIGIYKSFIHVDYDLDKPACLWIKTK